MDERAMDERAIDYVIRTINTPLAYSYNDLERLRNAVNEAIAKRETVRNG